MVSKPVSRLLFISLEIHPQQIADECARPIPNGRTFEKLPATLYDPGNACP